MADTSADWPAENPLEEALDAAKAGRLPIPQYLQRLMAEPLFVLSTQEVQPDGSGLAPLVFDRQGVPCAAVFTSMRRAENFQRAAKPAETAQFLLRLPGHGFLTRVPSGYGVLINPGFALCSEISPEGLPKILRDFQVSDTEPSDRGIIPGR